MCVIMRVYIYMYIWQLGWTFIKTDFFLFTPLIELRLVPHRHYCYCYYRGYRRCWDCRCWTRTF